MGSGSLAVTPMHRHIPPTVRRRLPSRTVALIAFDGLQALDLVGPMEVFAKAAEHAPSTGAMKRWHLPKWLIAWTRCRR